MPVHKTKDGYKYGKTGKTYKDKKSAIKQALAIAYSQAREKGRKPTEAEIKSHISGNPDKINKKASVGGMKHKTLESVLYKQAAAYYNTYGLLPKAANELYGRINEPSAYVRERQRLLERYGYGQGDFKSRGEEAAHWYSYLNPFKVGSYIRNYKDRTERPDITQEEGDQYRINVAKKMARNFANGDAEAERVLFDEIMRRSEHNIARFKTYGKLREDYYTAPNQDYYDAPNKGNNMQGAQKPEQPAEPQGYYARWYARRQARNAEATTAKPAVAKPTGDEAKYQDRKLQSSYTPTDPKFLMRYKALSPEQRRLFDTVTSVA